MQCSYHRILKTWRYVTLLESPKVIGGPHPLLKEGGLPAAKVKNILKVQLKSTLTTDFFQTQLS